ncbi:hypothetical protein GA0070618_3963 [Micromonospora echinospora]|uniref:Uncharacterized protein n=1 Tax=Micromonospora echinospora TaxID=1877 RepID=A0A1C4YGJ1_MICEC|nr:hypothetical protein [Micromonospora echinospora]SCE76333.1 hypothetical protein GA0070618_0732 [Micromonospora echinospora]SCF19828.1 hypothetical protein GA0070618_3963 [Micromonospora echinospora]
MNLTVILDLITAREATADQAADRLREQITALTADLARIEGELADLKVTRTTLRILTAAEFTADDPTIASAPYQQILTVLDTTTTGMRAKDICLALGVDPIPKHVESARAKLKRMVKHHVLTENQPGVFTLTPKRT